MSARRRARSVAFVALAVAAGCAPRGQIVFDPAAATVGAREQVFVSTARAPVAGPELYGHDRKAPPDFAIFDVAVPPRRDAGTVTFPDPRHPDPETQFLVTSARRFAGEPEFRAAMNAALAADPSGEAEAMVFVHGFNVNFAEGVLRHAQIQHDYDRHDVAVLFSWPSAAKTWRYFDDRESALFARRALEETIASVASSDARQFNLVAHSMGAFLLMDTFSTMMRLGYDEAERKINAIFLLAPDIDLDVFKEEARPILERGVPIVVFASKHDEALRISAWLRGEHDRLGSLRDESELGGLPVTIYDITEVEAGDPLDHFAAATSPALLALFRILRHSDDFWEYTPPPGARTVGYVIRPTPGAAEIALDEDQTAPPRLPRAANPATPRIDRAEPAR